MADVEDHEYYSPRKHSDPGNGSRHHEYRSGDSQNSGGRSRRRDNAGDRDVHSEVDRERSRNRERDSERRRHKSRDLDRDRDDRHNRDYDRDYERRHRHKSPHSGRRSRDRSRSPSSRSDSHSRDSRRSSKKPSGFDLAPAAAISNAALPGQVGGLPHAAVPGVFPAMYPFTGAAQFGAIPAVTMHSMTQQATRHARRVYVGGLPPLANEQTIATFFSQVMMAIGGNTAGPGDAVVNVYINHEKKFAFVEMRTVEEASNAMALDGIIFEGVAVRVRRPTDYNPSVAATLGPSQPSPHLNLAAVGLTPGAVGGADGPDRVFVGGLPYYLTEAQIKELLESFGQLRGFDLVKDPETGNSKGYGFCVYQDPAVTDVACAALNGLKMGDKTLTVRRATASGQPKPDQTNVLLQAQQHITIQKLALQAGGSMVSGLVGLMPGLADAVAPAELPTRVVCLSQVVSIEELRDDEVFEEIFDDMKEECGKYGSLLSIVIPRPMADGELVCGLGKVFLEYSTSQEAVKAYSVLNGRRFGGNTVSAKYFPEDKFSIGEYDD